MKLACPSFNLIKRGRLSLPEQEDWTAAAIIAYVYFIKATLPSKERNANERFHDVTKRMSFLIWHFVVLSFLETVCRSVSSSCGMSLVEHRHSSAFSSIHVIIVWCRILSNSESWYSMKSPAAIFGDWEWSWRLHSVCVCWCKTSGTVLNAVMPKNVWLWIPLMSTCLFCSPKSMSQRGGYGLFCSGATYSYLSVISCSQSDDVLVVRAFNR